MSTKEQYKFLRDLNCCKSCCLRFLGHRNSEIYNNIEKSLEKLGLEEQVLERPEKRIKENVCVSCLHLLQEETMNYILQEIKLANVMKEYDNENIVCAISLPICLNLRALSIWLALLNKFPNSFSKDTVPDVPLKEVWKFIFGPKLVDAFNITLAPSGSILTIELDFANDVEELKKIYEMKPQIFNNRRNEPKKYNNMITRKFFDANFTPRHIKYEEFIAHYDIPPPIASEPLNIKSITVLGDTLFIAGRYNKYSRVLPQTPWIIDGKRMLESSVQEIIQEPIINLFKCDKNLVRFSSSGREDVDVRCLGQGRPFVLEMLDTKYTKAKFHELRDIEREINKNKDLVVRDLQLVKREDLVHIKHGEETKTKHYRALCVYTGPEVLSKDMIDVLNKPDGFEIQQKTPIRVLHRRPLITRPRVIHSMKAELLQDSPNLFYLDVETQAGTYVKELVHGDFGRTLPNVKELLTKYLKTEKGEQACKINVDIIALDVTAVNLDWPPPIENVESICKNNEIDL